MKEAVGVMSLDQSVSLQRDGVEKLGAAATVGHAPLVVSDQPRRAMTKTARVYKIEMLIRNRGHVSFQTLLDELEVSPATLKLDLDYLKDQLATPIEYDRILNGYQFDEEFGGQQHEMPTLRFSGREPCWSCWTDHAEATTSWSKVARPIDVTRPNSAPLLASPARGRLE